MEKESYSIIIEEGVDVKVTKEVYQCYYREQWRTEKYEAVWRTRSFSLEEAMAKGYNLSRRSSNIEKSLEELVIEREQMEVVRRVFNSLSKKDKELLMNLVVKEVGERAYAESCGIPRTTLNYRRKILLKYLREKINII